MSRLTALKEHLPWIQTPFIINAPMSGIAKSKLATAVTKAGGLGQIGYLDNLHELANELETAKQSLLEAEFDITKTLPHRSRCYSLWITATGMVDIIRKLQAGCGLAFLCRY
ncbi:hypothetical protein N7519_001883 [Penicillium mononematosum]|uniref:uncharacterized protein n=1 Tax=Penicillium mononematosum TaxID=268346 RepID=UPI0025486DAB|nr:uncharacterized protein N7519_001883 [Penicillium mononematosum]KAJ6186975.1 hypothetical protein N7519_001883 [Penicillium mononematosum]